MNQVVLVGRLTKNPEVTDLTDNKKRTTITLAVNRPFKNSDGIYETDFIKCILWNGIAANTSEFCHKGDIVGIKGRLETNIYEDTDKRKIYNIDVVAERVSFLATNKKNNEKETEI